MPRLSINDVSAEDLSKYLAEESDAFAFELGVVRMLRAQGLTCEHGGLYEDPVTKKSRQFDIRAISRDQNYCVRLAVECKNIGANFPLLISCIPRHPDESFHEIAIVGEIEDGPQQFGMYASRAHVIRLSQADSLYRFGSPVGKTLAQVGRDASKGNICFSQDEVFDKWAQCLASADELVCLSAGEGADDSPNISYVAVLPIVVVPDGRLWVAEYSADAQLKGPPIQKDQCSLFVNQAYDMEFNGPTMRLSHVEFVTMSGLRALVCDALKSREAMETIFPHEALERALENLRDGC